MNVGWEALEWIPARLGDAQRQVVHDSSPEMFAGFEHVCSGRG